MVPELLAELCEDYMCYSDAAGELMPRGGRHPSCVLIAF
ncbi:hypothetical protein BJQ89_02989 [Arthrobacter sp. ES1]|nr:hypothetical protein [Arthrobacter sp. ES1]